MDLAYYIVRSSLVKLQAAHCLLSCNTISGTVYGKEFPDAGNLAALFLGGYEMIA